MESSAVDWLRRKRKVEKIGFELFVRDLRRIREWR
jgi:hypothetical protein